MNQLRFFPHCIVFCIIVLLHSAAVGAGGEFAPHSTTDVEAQPEQPAGVPVLFIVKLANTGTQPISYWVALGGKYPSAKLFKARVTDGEGKVQELQMSNDYIEMGSGGFRQISP